jgi:hypothetical protein
MLLPAREDREVGTYRANNLEQMSATALYTGDSGSSGEGASWVRSTDYVKSIPQGELHVHAPKGFVTGANLQKDGEKTHLSNYEAAILDLQIGKVHKDTGNF